MKDGLAKQHKMAASADKLSFISHFTSDECKVLLYFYDKLICAYKILDRIKMREILQTAFLITDDVMLDCLFKSFDRDNDGYINDFEWVKGLSTMLRGTIMELIDFCYFVYDMNGDGSLAREELHHCLKGCIIAGYGVEADEIEDCERDIVEMSMKKLDSDHDGQITLSDFQVAVLQDPLLLQAIGPCLPGPRSAATFLALITEKFRNYTETYVRGWMKKGSRKSIKNFLMENASSTSTNFIKNKRKSMAPDTKLLQSIAPMKTK